MPHVTYIEPSGTPRVIEVPAGDNVMHGAVYNDVVGIVGECGGGLACATCHCYVDEAWTDRVGGPASADERDMLECTSAEIRPESRLSCQIVMGDELDGLIVHLPDSQY